MTAAEIRIPLLDLVAQHRSIADEARERVERVFAGQQFVLGPEVGQAEEEVARYSRTEFAVGVASGTDALLLSLWALGIGRGDEVITTPFTFFATASTVIHAGARPVFVDIEPDTCLIDAERAAEAVTHNSRAIVPVHLYGQAADMEAVLGLAQACGLAVLEDACQAIGAEFEGRRVGGIGDAGALSFYPSKNLSGAGDGGMVLTRRRDVADKVRRLHVYGHYEEYGRQYIGINSRLDSLQAAIVLAKLGRLDHWTDLRRAHAGRYREWFKDSAAVRPLVCRPGRAHVYNNYVVRVGRREELAAWLRERGIGSRVYYAEPLHQMACFKHYLGEVHLPQAEAAAKECLAIPCYPEMTDAMVDEVAEAVLGFYGEKG
jgi:dTDP-4-amino-4,6-dideoxygalactose transaminase